MVLVVAALALVHVLPTQADDNSASPRLPQHVADLRDAILTAAKSGEISELTTVLDMSGTVPDFGIGGQDDPVKALKALSADGDGREILAALIEVLSLPPVALPLGSDIENNLIYVWPYLAERPIDKLTPAEEVDLYRLVSPTEAAQMRQQKRWLWWRLVIAADGTWQSFRRLD
jgi:hypothetical protein